MNAAWRRVLPVLALLLVGLLLLYRDTAAAMVAIWARSDTYMHGFLVPPIVAWLVWRLRAQLAPLEPSPSAWVLLPLAAAAMMWLLGELGTALAVTLPAMVLLLVLTTAALLGRQVTRVLLFPLCFLFFAVPAGEFMVPYFMIWTADFTVVALRLTGIPVYREGLHFVIPSGNWSVIEACSGVRYLIASVMTGVLFAYLHYRSMRRRLLFVAVSFVVPIIANWLRAYLIVLLGHYSDNRLASGIDHVIYGWVFFGVVIFAMFYVGSFWSDADGVKQAAPAAPRVAAAPRRRLTHAVAAAAAALLTLPHVAAWALDGAGSSEPPYLERPLVLSPAWTPVDLPVPVRWKPSFRNASAELQQVYRGPRGEVGLYLAYYRHQNFERKLVSTDNVLAKSRDPDWTQTSRGRASIDAGGRSLTVRTASLRHTPTFGRAEIESQITVRQFYWVNGTVTDNDYVAKGYGALQRLLGRGDDAAAVIVYAHHDAGTDADALLTSFLADNAALLDERLRRVRDGLLQSAALKPNNS